jgi:hypothetical protein
VKTLCLVAALAIVVPPAVFAADDDPTPSPAPRELSLAERAEAARKQAEAQGRSRDGKPGGRVLNNEDLKKAKGNVIYLQASPGSSSGTSASASASTNVAPPAALPSSATIDVPVAKVPPGAPADLIRELDESRGRAIRLRGTIDDTQRALTEASAGERPALEERLRSTLNELLQTQEAIGVLSERMRQSDPASGPKDK